LRRCAGYPNACYLPQEATGPDAAYLYGQCVFTTMHKHSLALADELISAASTPHAAHKVRGGAQGCCRARPEAGGQHHPGAGSARRWLQRSASATGAGSQK
jgi:hypothetical protein